MPSNIIGSHACFVGNAIACGDMAAVKVPEMAPGANTRCCKHQKPPPAVSNNPSPAGMCVSFCVSFCGLSVSFGGLSVSFGGHLEDAP